jgi:hypothetical protein
VSVAVRETRCSPVIALPACAESVQDARLVHVGYKSLFGALELTLPKKRRRSDRSGARHDACCGGSVFFGCPAAGRGGVAEERCERGRAMLPTAISLCTFILLAGTAAGCGPVPPSQLSLTSMSIAPPPQMVARVSSRTAYIVLDPAKVPGQLTVFVDGVDRGGRLTDVQTFVTRDLQRALSAYFERVEVISPGQPTGNMPSAIVDVKIDRVDAIISQTSIQEAPGFHLGDGRQEVAGGSAVLTWGLGIRLSEAPDYAFSFSDGSASVPSDDPRVAYRSMFERAIAKMLNRYNEQHTQELILRSQPSSHAS